MCECISAEIKIIKMKIQNFQCGYTKCGREKKKNNHNRQQNNPHILICFYSAPFSCLCHLACVMSVGIHSHVRNKASEPERKGVILTADLQDITKLALLALLLSLPFISDPCFAVNKFVDPHITESYEPNLY